MAGDAAYFARRAQEERIAAMAASHPGARDAHLELARRYADFAQAFADRHRQLGLDLYEDDSAISRADRPTDLAG